MTAFYYAIVDIYKISAQTVSYLGKMIVGEQSTEGLSGPLGIAKITGQIAQKGLVISRKPPAYPQFGLINFFPFQCWTGDIFYFILFEAIVGVPSWKCLKVGYPYLFSLGYSFMVISTWNDLQKLKVFEFFKNFFN